MVSLPACHKVITLNGFYCTCFKADFLGNIPLPPMLIVVVAEAVICDGPIKDPPCISVKDLRPEPETVFLSSGDSKVGDPACCKQFGSDGLRSMY